jgi:hypothetical protein
LRGESDAFDCLGESVGLQSALHTEAMSAGARPASATKPIRDAWERRDFGRVAALIEALPGGRTFGEAEALRYARHHVPTG